MHVPPAFAETRVEALHDLMRTHPLATLVVAGTTGLEAGHVPLLLDASPLPYGTLQGHVARVNPIWRYLDGSSEALAIFGSPGVYVTPSWYASKQAHGKVVPTWDYAVVHAKGASTLHEDAAWLHEHLERMVTTFEKTQVTPWKMTDAPSDFIAKLLPGVVGFEIRISALVGQWKVSQNRPEADRQGVIYGLRERGDDEATYIASLVAQRGTQEY
jgi:transcriptional regulator